MPDHVPLVTYSGAAYLFLTCLSGRRLGQPPLVEGEDGYDDLAGPVDTLFLQQLMPELAETAEGAGQVVVELRSAIAWTDAPAG